MQSPQHLRSLAFVDRELIEQRSIRFTESRAENDVKTMMSLLARHAVYTTPGDRTFLPCFGSHSGRDAILLFFQRFHVEYEIVRQQIQDVLVDGGRAAVQHSCALRHRGTGILTNIEICDLIRFEDGLIVDVLSFMDTLAVAEALEPRSTAR